MFQNMKSIMFQIKSKGQLPIMNFMLENLRFQCSIKLGMISLISRINWQRAWEDYIKGLIQMQIIRLGFFFFRVLIHSHAIFSESHQQKFSSESETLDNLLLEKKGNL